MLWVKKSLLLMNQTKEHIIKTENLSIGYASKKQDSDIASNLTINLEAGNLVCLLGKNGIEKVIELDLNEGERAMLADSEKAVREVKAILDGMNV